MKTHLLATALLLGSLTLPARDWQQDVANAVKFQNTVQGTFTDGSRQAFLITSPLFSITADLSTKNGTVSLATPDGIPLAENAFDAYVTTSDNLTFRSSQSIIPGRMNTFRIGYYYYDTHILDQKFCRREAPAQKTGLKPVDVSGFVPGTWTPNEVSEPVFANGVMSFTCNDTHDPWMARLGLKISTNEYNVLQFAMKNTNSSMLTVYAAIGDYPSFNGDQHLNIPLHADGQFHTYKVYLDNMVGFKGDIHGIRFDLGQIVGERVEVKDIVLLPEKQQALPICLDRIFHTFPDKTHQTLRYVVGSSPVGVSEYGCELALPREAIADMIVKDANGVRHNIQGLAEESVEYIGFRFKRGGVFGLIFPDCPEAGALRVTATRTHVTLRQYRRPEGGTAPANAELLLNHRLYRDDSADFAGLARAAHIERHPLTAIDCPAYRGYSRLDGVYEFTVGGTGFNEAFFDIPQKHFACTPTFTGDDTDRVLYFRGHSTGGLECAALLDDAQLAVPMPLEVSKNFCGEKEEPYYYPTDDAYGETLFPFLLKANEKRTFTVLNLFQMWGQFPLKQLSSIQFFITYYHLSCGVTETNCIAPYYVYKKDGWTLPDFRAMSAKLWATQPQHFSLGPMRYPFYRTAERPKVMFEPKADRIDSAGPVYADVSFDYLSDDNAVALTTRHLEFPQTDENRTYYSFSWKILKPLSIASFKDDVKLYMLDTDWAPFRNLGYLDKDNRPAVAELPKLANGFIPLGTEHPYITVYHSLGRNSMCNYGLVVKNLRLTRNGTVTQPAALLAVEQANKRTRARLTLDMGRIDFQPGDRLDYDVILVPFGDADVANDQSVRTVRQDSTIAPYRLAVARGELVADTYLPRLKAAGNQAEFTLTGGAGNAVVRVDGFSSYRRPKFEVRQADGSYVPYKTNFHEYDGYQPLASADGTYSFAFVLDMSRQPAYTVRISQP